MKDFTFYIEDDRYQVATLRLVVGRDEARARALAVKCLEETVHHRSVEVCEHGRLLFTLNREYAADANDRAMAS
ncbi:MAG TPA: hypothetical protein VII63_08380 [Caulobacteraceae bacterium]